MEDLRTENTKRIADGCPPIAHGNKDINQHRGFVRSEAHVQYKEKRDIKKEKNPGRSVAATLSV